LVGYPLMRLEGTDHVGYVRNLEKVLVAALARLGLVSAQINGKTGVWVQADIASRCPRCKLEDRHTCPERTPSRCFPGVRGNRPKSPPSVLKWMQTESHGTVSH
jgi:hypothetical protein